MLYSRDLENIPYPNINKTDLKYSISWLKLYVQGDVTTRKKHTLMYFCIDTT